MRILIPPIAGSALALFALDVEPGDALPLADAEADSLVYVLGGGGSLRLAGEAAGLEGGSAALLLAGEEANLEAGADGLSLLLATAGPEADRHAPLGRRELVVAADTAGPDQATGYRSFRLLLGPHNGSTRATLFAGFVPPGRAPWHFHLYDEIVFVPGGPAKLHRRGSEEALGPGSAFRLRPREVHIVENADAERELTVIGIFTPAGSPAAAYLASDS